MNIGSDKKNKIQYIIFNWDYVRQQKIISHTIVITLKIYICDNATKESILNKYIFFDFYHYKSAHWTLNMSQVKIDYHKSISHRIIIFPFLEWKRRLGWFVRTLSMLVLHLGKISAEKETKQRKVFI